MDIIIIALASLLVGLAKGGFGGLPGALVTPLLTLVMPVSAAVGVALPLLMLADVFALRVYWRKWDWHHIKLLLPAAVVGIILGTRLLASLAEQDTLLRRILALLTIVVLVYKVVNDRLITIEYQHRDWHGYLAGGVAGFTSSLANLGGPPYIAYILLQNLSPQVFMGTTTLFFAAVNAIKLPFFLQTGVLDIHHLLGIVWAIPLVPLGVWLGRLYVDRVDPKVFERLILVMLVIVVVMLLSSGGEVSK
jgi:uncharacterized protein